MSSSLKPWLLDAYNEFKEALQLGRLPSSVIISGDLRLESASLAIKLAKLYLCQNPQDGNPCGICQSCLQLSDPNLSHPDFLGVLSTKKESFDNYADLSHKVSDLIENAEHPDGTVLRIDTLRRFSDWIYESSMGSHGKVAVISNAHLMPEASANAILKTFEEPPSNTLIIMLTKSTDALLPTILSRAFKLYIHRPNLKEAILDLQNLGVDTKYAKVALALNAQAPKAAANMISSGKIEKVLDLIASFANSLTKKSDPQDFIDKLFAKDDKTQVFSPQERAVILEEFLLELLKYKAHVNLELLPLLVDTDINTLSKIKAENIFKATSAVKFLYGGNNMTPLRASSLFIRAFIDDLQR